jgi:SOS-response transcriptional repressor LexA
MIINIGKTLADHRKAKKYMQKDVAAKLSEYGFDVSSKTIHNWEREIAVPNARHLISLCDILDISDPLWVFAGIDKGTFGGLNEYGRSKARELLDLLYEVDKYRSDYEYHSDLSSTVAEPIIEKIRLYDQPAAAGTGNFLDNTSYDDIDRDKSMPDDADFAIRVSGESMLPRFTDNQIVFIKRQQALNYGDFGIFVLNGESLIKKYGEHELISVNPKHDNIKIKESDSFYIFGKVVG